MKNRIINGVKCYAPSSRVELMDFAFKNKSILVAVNAEKILHANETTRSIINRNVGYPDGIGAVWALEKNGINPVVKIAGVELWLEIIKKYHSSKSFYLIGGQESVIQDTVKKLKQEYPNIDIVNYRNGYIKNDAEKEELKKDIFNKKPDVVFVAMGSPKQELLMEEFQSIHPAVYQGLGGSFDVYTGAVERAPNWWIKNNLEWAYRLVKQPSRIKRQIHLLRFYLNLKLNKY